MSKYQQIYELLPVFLQNIACSLEGWRIKRSRYNRYFYDTLCWLEETDRWPLERLREYQNQRLIHIIKHSYETVPYYKRQFDSMGIRPQDIQSVEDLDILPILTKEEVRTSRKDMISTKYSVNELKLMRTSGTTGAGMEFYRHPNTVAFQWAIWWRFRRRFNVNLGDRHANFAGKHVVPHSQETSPYWRYNAAINQVYFSTFHISEKTIKHYWKRLNQGDFVYYTGYPSTISIIARLFLENGLKIDTPPRAILTGSESLLPGQIQLIQEAFQCVVADQYGAAEHICNMSRCPAGYFHEDMELGIIEKIPVETSSGETVSRIIATGLIDEAMPLLRYEIGDLATYVGGQCACGRCSPIAKCIDGRIEDTILAPDGRRIGRLANLFAEMLTVRESQVVQESIDHITIRIIKSPSYTGDDEIYFKKKLQSLVGSNMKITFEYTNQLEKTSQGKLRAVISKIQGCNNPRK